MVSLSSDFLEKVGRVVALGFDQLTQLMIARVLAVLAGDVKCVDRTFLRCDVFCLGRLGLAGQDFLSGRFSSMTDCKSLLVTGLSF